MKIFISADIEGVTTITRWEESDPRSSFYPIHADQMTNEVLAACEGAIAAGAEKIVVRDAHGPGCNLNPTRFPKQVTLVRGWSHCPEFMVEGIDGSFDAAMFIGYHSAAGRCGNPMSHTVSTRHTGVFINGRRASEFMIYSWAAALYGVPTVFLSGDKMLCDDDAELHPAISVVSVKDGIGGATYCRSIEETIPEIRAKSERSLRQDLNAAITTLPEKFDVEIHFNDHNYTEKVSYFPDVRKTADNIISFSRNDYYEVLRTLMWLLNVA